MPSCWKCLKPVTLFLGLVLSGFAYAAEGLWQLPDEFVDEFGNHAPLKHWAGAQTVVSMEYTSCKFVCSTYWRRLVEIQTEADRRQIKIHFLVISLDPEHDTPQEWRDYRKVRGLTRDNWSLVTGSRASTDKVVAALGVKWWYFNDSIMHDFKVSMLDQSGNQLAVMDSFTESPATFLSAKPIN